MGRLFRVFRGDWKKNQRDHWHFLPSPTDFGWTMFVEEAENYEVVEGAIREQYGVGETTPVVITYGMPEWMVFPSGNIPPLAISTSHDLRSPLTERPWLTEVTLLATLGARSVAEYNFLRRSNFTIGATTYVVNGAQDERERAIFEGLVYGQRLETSERVMGEIFGEQEMQLLYRVALEMAHVDRDGGFNAISGVGQGIDVIHIDDDEDMRMLLTWEGILLKLLPLLVPINASQAPSVLWDVGLDLVNYPAFINTRRCADPEPNEIDFWRGLMEEEARATAGVGVNGEDGEGGATGVKLPTVEAERADVEGASSTGSTAIVCSQYGGRASALVKDVGEVTSKSYGGEENVGATKKNEASAVDVTIQLSDSLPNVSSASASPLPSLSLPTDPVSGDPTEAPPKMKTEKAVKLLCNRLGLTVKRVCEADLYDHAREIKYTVSCEMGDNVLQLAVGMMFRNKDGFKQHMALYAIENKFCFRSPKSDQSLVILVCQGTGCPWRVYAARLKDCELTGGYEVKEIAEKEYEVRNKMGSSFHVNIGTLSCSCFEFQMLSIPCSHAISAALRANVEVDTLVTEAYKVAFLRRAYEGSIAPVTDYTTLSDLPTAFSALRLSPPATRRPPGRPKKLRYFSRGEKLVKSFRRRIACSRCKALGHNKATCKNAI
ncbi:hypothetical protein F2Q69_00024951 [Brassica cretica]|uniref:SWIM-type domain-containing protein n=1 Tax=Brassica cretica TaxID=69181 RepID=A0A8S9QHU5_BRACR|nr:hypothetical protein F2Q69_00024951 [Brassica cretica]